MFNFKYFFLLFGYCYFEYKLNKYEIICFNYHEIQYFEYVGQGVGVYFVTLFFVQMFIDCRSSVYSILIPLSNRTNFTGAPGCTHWSSSVWKVFADELPVNTDETPMNFWAKVTHLDPYSLIESSSVFNGGSRGRNPVWKASRWTPMKFWVLRTVATYTSCWAVGLLMTSFAVEWFSSVFIGVWSERVE